MTRHAYNIYIYIWHSITPFWRFISAKPSSTSLQREASWKWTSRSFQTGHNLLSFSKDFPQINAEKNRRMEVDGDINSLETISLHDPNQQHCSQGGEKKQRGGCTKVLLKLLRIMDNSGWCCECKCQWVAELAGVGLGHPSPWNVVLVAAC